MNIYGKSAAIVVRTILHLLCKVDKRELKKLPRKGPYIIAMNHINFLEVPMIFVDLFPRKIHGIAKKETWDNPVLKILANIWETVPIDREGFTANTFRKVKEHLGNDKIIIIAPEGTRTGDGKLKKAHPGIITMAQQSDVPIYPVVHFGGELFWDNLVKFKRTRFTFEVGKPIKIKKVKSTDKSIRHKQVDQLMFRMAELLPEKYRGNYKDIDKINNKYVEEVEDE
ncbi:MAG: 1-acyl-sn-glycerol-3-phosphate acyltransferase [Candidatus Cloacimonetes bacterium]|nr:1-acyl-sn-glycerol-3-phosphate acyltransferase [Candidatus Cloacimonadota bacterium]MCF7814460.1 1-acyl-sn-glycerol-3-phosphate acyltransferase [Candidatus Cloacimonadota bacterium]MCF7869035.1 1-acyl-sn-glycerol-3-phosphate acyltransferase [Candidatus Cloacimonadota bacterium]MCF7884430.1 1-acyl-sn-glycerol-3-phosphate acyltransferase [Candidatus Cloacimonadota bacterium]